MSVEHKRVLHGQRFSFVNRAGKGRPEAVMFLHGSGPGASAWSNWQYALPVFGEHYDSIAPDWLGFGESFHPDPSPRNFRDWISMWVTQICELQDVLGLERVHLIGNSLGGAIALHLVANAPQRFGKVVLMGSVGAPMRLTPELDSVWGFYDAPSEEKMRRMIRWFAFDQGLIEDRLEEIARMRFDAAMRTDVQRSYAAMFPAPRQRHLDELVLPVADLCRMEHPFLLVYGRDDVIIPLNSSDYLLRNLLGPVELHVYGRTSHWIQMEHRDSFHRLLLDFLGNGT